LRALHLNVFDQPQYMGFSKDPIQPHFMDLFYWRRLFPASSSLILDTK
jgi:hypothetical protein